MTLYNARARDEHGEWVREVEIHEPVQLVLRGFEQIPTGQSINHFGVGWFVIELGETLDGTEGILPLQELEGN